MAMATPAASTTLSLLLPASPPMRLRARRPPARTRRSSRPLLLRASCAYALREGQSRRFHRLPCGLDLEVIAQQPPAPGAPGATAERPPLVFVHGSFHAAWCWAEHWLPFFSRAGFPCYALSLRAQGESSVPPEKVAGTLETHTGDIADFMKEVSLPPVLIGHSFGGLIVQQYISCLGGSELLHPKLAGAVLVCSVPPSGNSRLVWRYLLTKPVAAIKVTLSLAAKRFANSLSLCKETFFSPEMDDDLVQRYQGLMKDSSKLPLFDLRKLNASLPVASVPNNTVNILIVGANSDFIVDAEGLSETARFYNVQPVCIEGIAHDMMLDCSWDKGAGIILSWLEKLTPR